MDLHRPAKLRAAPGAVLKPALNFPADFKANLLSTLAHAGATVNGVPSNVPGNLSISESERY